jgi:lysophospholipase L1-like esterase
MNVNHRLIINRLRSGKTYRIAFLGDSLTSAEWVHPNWREIVEYVLKEELINAFDGKWHIPSWQLRFYNAGFDGSTTRDWLAKLDTEVLALRPNLLIVMGTLNDELFGIPPAQSAANIERLLDKALAAGVDTLVYANGTSTSANGRTESEAYISGARAIFPHKGVQFVDMAKLFNELDTALFYTFRESKDNPVTGSKAGDIDTSHPNRLGQAYTAKLFLKHVFGIDFDPELYLRDLYADTKYPRY